MQPRNHLSKIIATIFMVLVCFLTHAQSVCETPITGTVDSRVASWQYIGAVSEGLNYALEPTGGSKSFTSTNGPETGNTVYSVIFNTSTGKHISLSRNRYYSNNSWYQTLTGTYHNAPHPWTGLSGGPTENAPILGYIAFIDENGNGTYDSGSEQYIRDVVSLTIAADRTGDLYMAFYDDGSYNDNSATLTISATPTNCPTDLEVTKTDWVPNYERGQNTVYTIVAKNNGPVDIENATVSDPIPAGVNSFSWTADLYETASNSSGTSGSGAINDVVNLAVGDSIVYTVTAAVSGTKYGALENIVTINTPIGTEDLDSSNNVANDIDVDPDPTSCFIMMTDFEDYTTCTPAGFDAFNGAYSGNSAWTNSAHTAGIFINNPGTCTNIPGGSILPDVDGGTAYAGLHSLLGRPNSLEVIIGTLPTSLLANQEYTISFLGVSMNIWNDAIWDNYGEVDFFGIAEGTSPVLNDVTQQNWTTISAIPEVDYLGTSATITNRAEWEEYSFNFTPTRDLDRLLLAPRGDWAYVGIDNIIVKVAAQTIEVDTVTICSGTSNTVLPYNIISGTPDEYAIDWDNAANTVGISDVAQTTLPVDNQFVISGLTSVPAGSYTAEVTVYNSQLGCEGVNSIIFTVNPIPNVLLTTDTTICFGNNVVLDAGVQDSIVWSFGGATTQTIAVDETNEYIAEVYNEFGCSDTDSVQITVQDCPVNLIYADTLIICKGDTALIEAMHMEDPIWSTDRQVTVNDSTIKAYPEKTSVYTVERTLSRKDLLVNSDFEDVNLPGTNAQLDASLVNGWNTTATDNKIEIWRDGFLGHPAYSGTFFAELNATQPSALYQDVETTEGEIIKWGFAHRGRVTTETMQLKIGPVNGPYEVIGDFTDGPTAWRYYSGEYIVPAGQKDTRFLFSAVDLNAAANLIDAPSFEAVIRHQDSVVVVVYELPEVVVNDTIICIGDTVQFSAISTTATEYLWKQNGTGTNQNSEGSRVGIYEVIITDINGCKDTTEAELTYHNPPTVIVNNDTICIGDPDGQFIAKSTTAISYIWGENGSGNLNNTAGSIAGDYTVIIEDINTCKDTANGVLKIDTLPIVNLEGAAICASEPSVDLKAESITAIKYQWSGLSAGTTQTITASNTGKYIVTVTDENGCKNLDEADLQKYDLPIVTIADETVCLGDTAEFKAISATATEYLWKQNGLGVKQTSKGYQAGFYEVIVTDVNGCKDTTDALLTLYPLPVVTVNNDTICIADPAGEFIATSATAISYVWSDNGSGSLATTLGSIAGDYTVVATDINTCKDTATGVLKVDTLPHVFVADTAICSNVLSVNFTAQSTTAKLYEWGGSGSGTTQIITASDIGNYTVIVTDENGCKKQADGNLYGVDQPDLFIIEGDSLACEGDEIEFLIDVNTNKIEWNTTETTKDIIVTSTGEYDVVVSNEGYGITCSEGSSKSVEFLPYPIVPNEETFINCFDYIDETTIKITSPANVFWEDTESSREDSLLIVLEEGIYNATLSYYEMCPIEVQREVIEFCPMTFFVPNAFTPNGDGLNDTFEPKMSNIETYKIMIFNRWGDLIFTSYDPSNQWDGTVNTNEVQIDVYVYKIVVTGFYQMGDLDSKELVGTVTVIR